MSFKMLKNTNLMKMTPRKKSERKINAVQINEANLLVFYKYFHERTWNMASSEIICTLSGSAMGISRRGKSVSCQRHDHVGTVFIPIPRTVKYSPH